MPSAGNLMSLAAVAVAGPGPGGCKACPGVFDAFGEDAEDRTVHDGRPAPPRRPGLSMI